MTSKEGSTNGFSCGLNAKALHFNIPNNVICWNFSACYNSGIIGCRTEHVKLCRTNETEEVVVSLCQLLLSGFTVTNAAPSVQPGETYCCHFSQLSKNLWPRLLSVVQKYIKEEASTATACNHGN